MSGRAFLFQINVTRDCNLRCTHCYISTDKKASSQFMSKDQLIHIVQGAIDFLKHDAETKQEYSLADIHIIGGEPSMLGVKFFKEVMPIIKDMLSHVTQEVKLSIVTNMITQQALRIAELFDSVATSFEYDTRFLSKTGAPKPELEDKWLSNIHAFQASGREISVTTAVTNQVIARGARTLLDYFYENNLKSIHLGFFIPSGDGLTNMGTIFPMFHESSQFMIDAADWYMERRLVDELLYVNPIESMIESVYHQRPLDDVICPIIPGSLDVDWNGETVTCIEAGGEVDFESLGNAFQIPIKEILTSSKYRRERTKAIVPKPNCVGCDELESCQSACGVLHQYWNGEGECPGFKAFIKHIRRLVEIHGVKPKSVIFRESFLKANKPTGC